MAEAIGFNGQTHVMKGNGDNVADLPVMITPMGITLSKWALTEEEILTVVNEGHVWLAQMTFGQPLQPQSLIIGDPFSPEPQS